MTVLVLGLLLFLGTHSLRIFADGWRTQQIERIGMNGWRGAYALLAGVGLALVIWGFGLARHDSLQLWTSPLWLRHLTALLTLGAFILFAAAHVPRNRIKAFVGHPMVAGVTLWAFGHLLANGSLAAALLFGAFLLWAVLDFASLRSRDDAAGTVYPVGSPARDGAVILAGVVAWVVFAFVLHGWLIGVRPLA
jgi:uncharacterized membrane protein